MCMFFKIMVGIMEATSCKTGLDLSSSGGEMCSRCGTVCENLTIAGLSLECVSEKLGNLHILMLHTAQIESDFDAYKLEKQHILIDNSITEALEFNFLCEILHSEVIELNNILMDRCDYLLKVGLMVHPCQQCRDKFLVIIRLLVQSSDQASEIRAHSFKLQKTLLYFREKNLNAENDPNFGEDGQFSKLHLNITKDSLKQRTECLRLLEQSLEREIDLEMRLSGSMEIINCLRGKQCSLEREICSVEEDAAVAYEKSLETEVSATVHQGISRDLLHQLRDFQIDLGNYIERKAKLKSMEITIDDLNKKLSSAESRKERAEAENKALMDNANRDMEKQNLLLATISDLENLTDDLQDKVEFLKACRIRTDEEKKEATRTIDLQVRKMTDLVMQLAAERDHLHKHILALESENNLLAFKLQQAGLISFGREVFCGISEIKYASAPNCEQDKLASVDETEVAADDSIMKLENVRRIDVGLLNFFHIFMVVFIMLFFIVMVY